MDLADATWTDVADSEAAAAVLPVGSTEQHGPHDPLGTDTKAATTIAAAGSAAIDREVLVAPTVPVGVSAEHRQFPGTMWVSPSTFRAYVREAIESLVSHGIGRVVIVNGHGGNVPAIGEVAAEVSRSEADGYVVAFTWFDAIDVPEMGHAGAAETALMLAIEPDLVRTDRLEAATAGAADGWGVIVRNTSLAHDSAAFAPNGTVGDPSGADPARGEELIAAAGAALGEVIDAMCERDPADLVGPRR